MTTKFLKFNYGDTKLPRLRFTQGKSSWDDIKNFISNQLSLSLNDNCYITINNKSINNYDELKSAILLSNKLNINVTIKVRFL